MSLRSVLNKAMNERDFQKAIIDAAHQLGWFVAHFRPAQIRLGKWVTPVQADGAGFPDLVMVKDGMMIIAEVKTERGVLSPEQRIWISKMSALERKNRGVVLIRVWKPRHWDQIIHLLKGETEIDAIRQDAHRLLNKYKESEE